MATMTDLQPGVRYFYVYGDSQWGKSAEHSFVMGPAAGPESTVRVLATADMVGWGARLLIPRPPTVPACLDPSSCLEASAAISLAAFLRQPLMSHDCPMQQLALSGRSSASQQGMLLPAPARFDPVSFRESCCYIIL